MANGERKQALALLVLAIFWFGVACAFRDGLGLVVFLALGLATIVQLIRVALRGGDNKTLRQLGSAFKDAFWGIG
ncbi:hypothetical protein ASE43_02730 [Lysobacter sp. Root983]|nr:hypothetical protein ASE43_02730 [Lysobacter sp. Root983]